VQDVYHGTRTSRVQKRQPKIVSKNWKFHEPDNERIQKRLTRSLQKMRSPDVQIVSLETFECIICNMKERTMSKFGSQFVYCGGYDANCFVPVCPVVTNKS
jgi:hypothetical protein